MVDRRIYLILGELNKNYKFHTELYEPDRREEDMLV
jgi:hypothetical protein